MLTIQKVTGVAHNLNVAMCDILGLDPMKVRKITITFSVTGPPMVEIERVLADLDENHQVRTVLAEYELHPKHTT